MTELFLLARVAGQSIALHASHVEGVVDIESVTPVPCTPPHVIGLAAVRSQVVTLIDVACALGELPLEPIGRAVVTMIDGHRYALRVDAVDDVVLLPAAVPIKRTQITPGWRDAVLGRLQVGDAFALLLDPARIVSPSLFPGSVAPVPVSVALVRSIAA